MENVIVWLVVTLVGSFGGSYLGAYFKKKGENLKSVLLPTILLCFIFACSEPGECNS